MSKKDFIRVFLMSTLIYFMSSFILKHVNVSGYGSVIIAVIIGLLCCIPLGSNIQEIIKTSQENENDQ